MRGQPGAGCGAGSGLRCGGASQLVSRAASCSRFRCTSRPALPTAPQKDGQFLNGHDLFLKRVGAAYHAFIDEFERGSRAKCMEDLQSTTRYVTWSLHTKSRSSLKAMLSKVTAPNGGTAAAHGHGGKGQPGVGESSGATADFLENTLWNRTLGSMSEEIVAALVCQIFEGARRGRCSEGVRWREHWALGVRGGLPALTGDSPRLPASAPPQASATTLCSLWSSSSTASS